MIKLGAIQSNISFGLKCSCGKSHDVKVLKPSCRRKEDKKEFVFCRNYTSAINNNTKYSLLFRS